VLIARRFLEQFAHEDDKQFRGFSDDAEQALLAYPWPGNVRQLQNVVRNVVVLHDGPLVELSMLPLPLDPSTYEPQPELEPSLLPDPQPAIAADMPDIVPLAEMERRMIQAALARTGGDVPRAAVLLEVNPSTIYRKLQAWKAAGRLG